MFVICRLMETIKETVLGEEENSERKLKLKMHEVGKISERTKQVCFGEGVIFGMRIEANNRI